MATEKQPKASVSLTEISKTSAVESGSVVPLSSLDSQPVSATATTAADMEKEKSDLLKSEYYWISGCFRVQKQEFLIKAGGGADAKDMADGPTDSHEQKKKQDEDEKSQTVIVYGPGIAPADKDLQHGFQKMTKSIVEILTVRLRHSHEDAKKRSTTAAVAAPTLLLLPPPVEDSQRDIGFKQKDWKIHVQKSLGTGMSVLEYLKSKVFTSIGTRWSIIHFPSSSFSVKQKIRETLIGLPVWVFAMSKLDPINTAYTTQYHQIIRVLAPIPATIVSYHTYIHADGDLIIDEITVKCQGEAGFVFPINDERDLWLRET
jgi:hypothetical protein